MACNRMTTDRMATDPMTTIPMTTIPMTAVADRGKQAELGIARLLSISIAGAVVLQLVVSAEYRASQSAVFLPWWNLAAYALVFAVPLFGGAIAPWSSLTLLRHINATTTVGYLLVLVSWLAASRVVPGYSTRIHDYAWMGPSHGYPWILLAMAHVLVASSLAFGGRRSVAVLAIVSVAVLALLLRSPDSTGATGAVIGLQDAGQRIIANTVFLAFATSLLGAARALDTAGAAAIHTERRLAAARAQERARAVAHAFVHDNVLATLRYVSTANALVRAAVTRQAQQTLVEMSEMRPPVGSAESSVELVQSLRALVGNLSRDVTVDVTRGPAAHRGPSSDAQPWRVPSGTADAIRGSLAQAVANSLAHAGGRDVQRSVRIVSNPEGIRVTLRDDGRGFDRAGEMGNGLGVSVSIIERMTVEVGGSASIRSRPGHGTVVEIAWSPDLLVSGLRGRSSARSHRQESWVWSGRRVAPPAFIAAEAALSAAGWEDPAGRLPSAIALATLAIGVLLVDWGNTQALSRPRKWGVALALITSVAMIFYVPVIADAPRESAWQLVGVAVILLALALHDLGLACALMALVTVMTIGASLAHGGGIGAGIGLVVRPAGIFLIGAIFVVSLRRMQQRIATQRRHELALARDLAFEDTLQAEHTRHESRLNAVARPTLELLSSARPLTPAEISQCVVLEGELRDSIRGPRLAREPLTGAAASARQRGIDVQLCDDGVEREIGEPELEKIAAWLAEHLDRVDAGEFTGRITGEAGGVVATAVVRHDTRVSRDTLHVR